MSEKFLKDRLDTAARIRQIRETAGLTQESFAEILGISLSGNNKIENAENQISLNGLRKLNRKLQVSTDYILLGENENSNIVWDQIMNCSDSDKMFLMIKLLYYFTKTKDSIFYHKEEQENIDKAILHIMEELKKI